MCCIMAFGKILCRYLKNIVVVEDGIKLGGEEIVDIASSDCSFKCDIDDNFEGKRTVSEKDGNR